MKRLVGVLLALLFCCSILPAMAEQAVEPSVDRGIVPQGRDAEGHFPNNAVVPGQSPTTGLAIDTPYIPVLVNIGNVAGAWPQWGISRADIVYEMPIYAHSMTRLMALYTQNHPQEAGPLRSARVMHAEMRQEWDAAWAFAGVQRMAGSNVNEALRELGAREGDIDLILNVNGGAGNKLYRERRERKAPHSYSFQVADAAQQVAGYDFPQRPFLFTDDLPQQGDNATSLRLLYNRGREDSYTNSSYTYDIQTNLYTRFRQGAPYVDMDYPDATLTFSNVIVQWTELRFNKGNNSAPLVQLVGEGNADIFMGGRHIAGYWVRTDLDSRTVFFDQEGQEIQLQRGKTWINITSPRSTVVKYQ